MPLLSKHGRLFVRTGAAAALMPAVYDGDPPWDFVLALRRKPDRSGSEIAGLFRRGTDSADLSAPLVVTSSGWLVFEQSVGRFRHFGAFGILGSLRGQPAVTLPTSEEGPFLESLYGLSALPKLDLPKHSRSEEIAGAPSRTSRSVRPTREAGRPARRIARSPSFPFAMAGLGRLQRSPRGGRPDGRAPPVPTRPGRRDGSRRQAAGSGIPARPRAFERRRATRADTTSRRRAAGGRGTPRGSRMAGGSRGEGVSAGGALPAVGHQRGRLVRSRMPRSTSTGSPPPSPSFCARSAAATT